MTNLVITILAGGRGKRMKSDLPKVLHLVANVPMIIRILKQILLLNPEKIIIVVGDFKDQIQETIEKYIELNTLNIQYALQEIPQGTGHAVLQTLDLLQDTDINLIVNGDNPLLTCKTLKEILNSFNKGLQITAIESPNPFGCGRIIVENAIFQKIVEEKDCTNEERQINIINCGIYLANGNILKKYIPQIKNNNMSKEYYITDIVELYKNDNNIVSLHILDDSKDLEMVNINTKDELDRINKIISN
jgi:UDP-N-acetylglucosamine diphosphorylase/glucosamine-1-phosphate N-acetyltransferase